MKCHYEILDIDQKANDDEIKRAYRKLALKWHPDKNPDQVEECTRYFPLIQQAYDVLSDAHERAWYDKHRQDILRGGYGEHYKDNSLNLFPYFSSQCYSDYSDNDKGFYAVYRDVFSTIASEDMDYIENCDENMFPSFGNSTSLHHEVNRFYGFWSAYTTAKSYAWLDQYDLREAVNRRVARAMEKENQLLRTAGKRERNEQVRQLVAFVRKRDKRVIAFKKFLEEKRIEQEKQTEENRKAQLLRRLQDVKTYSGAAFEDHDERELNLQAIEMALDEQFGEYKQETAEDCDDCISDQNQQSLYCLACEKVFKTFKAMENHEKSKKHKDVVENLKMHMRAEDVSLLNLSDKNDAELGDKEVEKRSKKSRRRQRRERKDGNCEKNSDASTSDIEPEDDIEQNQVLLDENLDQKKCESSLGNDVVISTLSENTNKDIVISKKESTEGRGRKKTENVQQSTETRSGKCDFCSQIFPSRTKLFAHLKESGHATVKTISATNSTTKKRNKK